MTPDFIVKAGDNDLTPEFKKRLVSLVVVDDNGTASDTLTITLDNTDRGIAFPEKGADLQCFLGYEGDLNYMGQFTVDDVQLPLHVDRITIVATGAKFRSSYREKRDTSYSDTNVKDIVETVAGRNGFKAAVSDALADIPVVHYQQKSQSDSALMVALRERFGLMIKPVGDKLVAVPDGEGKSVSGKTLPVIPVALSDIETGSVNLNGRSQYTAVSASYRDFDKAETIWLNEGDMSGKVKRLSQVFDSEQAARVAVKRKLDEITRKHFLIDVQKMAGNTAIKSKRVVEFSGHFSSEASGAWEVERAVHKLDSKGLVTGWSGKAPKSRRAARL